MGGMSSLHRLPGVADVSVGVSTRYGSKPHFHDGYSVGIFHGVARIQFRDGLHQIADGQLVVLEPYEVHGGGDESGHCLQDGLVIAPDLVRRLYGADRPFEFDPAIVRDSSLTMRFHRAVVERSEAHLVAAVVELFERHGIPRPAGRESHARRATDMTATSIADQAASAHLSRFQYSRKVKGATGLTPCEYRRLQRVEAARAMIEDGGDLAEVAAEAGFSDQAHMTRQLRMLLGVTPGALRDQDR